MVAIILPFGLMRTYNPVGEVYAAVADIICAFVHEEAILRRHQDMHKVI
jgi:hypothetical protein